VATSAPPRLMPTMRPPALISEPSASALHSAAGPTTTDPKRPSAGSSMAVTTPLSSEMRYTGQSSCEPLKTTRASPAASDAWTS
jgi:hypothetical protein